MDFRLFHYAAEAVAHRVSYGEMVWDHGIAYKLAMEANKVLILVVTTHCRSSSEGSVEPLRKFNVEAPQRDQDLSHQQPVPFASLSVSAHLPVPRIHLLAEWQHRRGKYVWFQFVGYGEFRIRSEDRCVSNVE